jgi:YVTN family beta-propeller protein
MSLQAISEDHYAKTFYGTQPRTFTRQNIGTHYLVVGIRTLVDPTNPEDTKKAHALQNATKVSQTSPGKFEVPKWDPASQKKVPDFKKAFGTKEQVDPVRHLIGTAVGWGGNPDKDATYLNITPAKNDGSTVYKLKVGNVPVDAFWSVSVYNAEGYFEKNPYNAYTLNNLTATKNGDGSIGIQFGGCNGKVPNCLPVVNGWNYTVITPDGKNAYVTNHLSHSVSVIDTATNTVVATVPVGMGPVGIGIAQPPPSAYVTNAGSNSVSVIDTATKTVTATVTVGVKPEG